MTDKEVVLAAAETLKIRGWCRNSYINKDGEMCVVGAVLLYVENSIQLQRICDDFMMFVGIEKFDCPQYKGVNPLEPTIFAWNNSVDMTQEIVISSLCKFADTLETQ